MYTVKGARQPLASFAIIRLDIQDEMWYTVTMNNDSVYLLNQSIHNEDFILDGCALSPDGLIEVAKRYLKDIYILDVDIDSMIASIDLEKKELKVTIGGEDYSHVFHIFRVPIVDVCS